MVEAQTWLINPCGVAMPPRYTMAPRTTLSPGAVLGVLNNGKTNVQVILECIAQALQQHFRFADVLYIRKPGVALPCPEEQLHALTSRCTVVVNGVGD
jgi:hypothetical protein